MFSVNKKSLQSNILWTVDDDNSLIVYENKKKMVHNNFHKTLKKNLKYLEEKIIYDSNGSFFDPLGIVFDKKGIYFKIKVNASRGPIIMLLELV